MYDIEITDAQTRAMIDLDRLKTVVDDVLRHEQVHSAEISVALIDGETMQRLNREHLGHDYDTDVLSFLLGVYGATDAGAEEIRGAGKSLDGEVLISTDVASKAASEFGWSVEDEVMLYLVHGLLHLVGYDDLTDDEKAVMRQRERTHLARWNLTPVYANTTDQDTVASDPASLPHVPSPGAES